MPSVTSSSGSLLASDFVSASARGHVAPVGMAYRWLYHLGHTWQRGLRPPR